VPFLLETLKQYPQVNYHIIDSQGYYDHTNTDRYSPIAVTWGVFPSREIAQPTVVDPVSFNFWKDEAFALWREQWQSLYEKNSQSYNIIQDICDNFYLVNLVDNDFIKGNCLFDVLNDVIEAKNKASESIVEEVNELEDINVDNEPKRLREHNDVLTISNYQKPILRVC